MARVPPRLSDSGQLVTQAQYNLLRDFVVENQVRFGPGFNVKRVPGADLVTLSTRIQQQGAGGQNPGGGGGATAFSLPFFARILSATPNATGYQWVYTFEEAHKPDQLGYSGNWLTRTNGKHGNAYNLNEYRVETAVDGIAGAGVDLANIGEGFNGSTPDFDGFTLQPCPVGNIVIMMIASPASANWEYWFQWENAVDGACS